MLSVAYGIIASAEGILLVQEYLEQSGLPHACLLTSIFFDNFAKLFHYHIQEDGSFVFTNNLGNAPHAWHAAADVGGSVTGRN